MVKTKLQHEEFRPLLVFALDPNKLNTSENSYETAVTRGAVNYLGRWPAHLFAVFITGSMVFAGFILFGVIITSLSAPSEERYRTFRNFESSLPPNLYFVKHENRIWSPMELCYIESTARTWKNLTVYLINLVTENQGVKPLSELGSEVLESRMKFPGPISIEIFDHEGKPVMIRKREFPNESRRRKKLAAFYSNIENIEVPIRHFFNGSVLANASDYLSSEMLELAARAYVLWNFPGVALDPMIQTDLASLNKYLCNSENDVSCVKEKAAVIRLDGDVLASQVPCQAFVGFLIRRMARKDQPQNRERTIESAIEKFCSRSFSGCPGVKKISLSNESPEIIQQEELDCPTVFPSRINKNKISIKN